MCRGAALILGVLSLAAAAASGADVAPAGRTAEQRYEEGRRLMQGGHYLEAAEVYRRVADSEDVPAALRAQALFNSGLMQENARNYERAVEIYQEVLQRFPDAPFAWQAQNALKALNAGGARGIEFRRRQDEAWDILIPAQELADRDGLTAARPALERAAVLLEALLRDFGDHPKAKDVATALGNVHMTLQEPAAARADFAQALALAQAQSPSPERGSSGPDSVVMDAESRLAESIRAGRRQWVTLAAEVTLAAIGVIVIALRPWRALDRQTLRFGANLVLAILALAALAAAASYAVRHLVDDHSTVEDGPAGLLVALPGLTGLVVSFGAMNGLRETLRFGAPRAAGVGATLGALAALAVAVCLINFFALFPTLDSNL